MNGELLYQVLLQASLFAMGAAAVSVGVLVRHKPRRWWAYALTKVGLSGIVATILTRIWATGSVEPSTAAYFYVAFVAASAVGMSFVAGDLAKRGGIVSAEKAVAKVTEEPSNHQRVRMMELEDRVTAEEARNTDIEEFATESRDRADAAETRADKHGESRPEEHDKG
jgi:hypothetical protein